MTQAAAQEGAPAASEAFIDFDDVWLRYGEDEDFAVENRLS
jgi:hypothetical protein